MINFNKLFYIIPKKYNFKILLLILFSFFGVFLEVIGIGAILPVIKLIISDERVMFGINFNQIYESSSFFKNFNFNNIIFFILFLLFFFKFCFFLFFTWYQNSFLANLSIQLSNTLFKKYIFFDYSFYFKKSVDEIMRNVMSEPAHYLKKILLPTIQTFMDIFILIGILSLIFFVDFYSSIILITIYGTFALIYLNLIKKKLIKIGNEQLDHDSKKIKTSQESFFGIKTIKIYLRELKFIERYMFHHEKIAHLSKLSSFIQQIPKYSIELLTIISFIILSLFLVNKSGNFAEIVPTLALFVASAFRIIPSINRITLNNQLMKTGIATQDNLFKELKMIEESKTALTESKQIKFNKFIKLKNLSFSYNNEEKDKIFDQINLHINKGDVVGIVGKTGYGKTTLVDLITGLLKPTKGTIQVDDFDIFTNERSWQRIIGYVPQETFLLNDTVKNNITFFSDYDDEELLKKCIKLSALDKFSLLNENTSIGERGISISGGQRQRIGIARALFKKPELIIFDESTNSLDEETENQIMDNIYSLRGQKTLIIISHKISNLNKCDKIFEVSNCKLVENKSTIS